MKAILIFYLASKTGYCESSLKNSLKESGIEITEISAAVNAEDLGKALTKAVNTVNTVFIIGGLTSNNQNIKKVLSNALSNQKISPKTQIIKNPLNKSVGYIIECKKQKLISLPDDYSSIEQMVDKKLVDYLLK